MKTREELSEMSFSELLEYIKEQEPIKEKKMEEAYAVEAPGGGPDMEAFMRLSEEACEPIALAHQYLKLIQKDYKLEPHDDIGNLMGFGEFKACCEGGAFIDYDGYGYYSTKDKQSDIPVYPSDITDGVYRKDFTHVKWYNK